MLPTNPGGHAAYQDTFVSRFLKFYPDPFVLPKSTWDYIVQFWYLDLSQTDSIMRECYSVFGPEPRLPSCMLHSYLLALKLKVSSSTASKLLPLLERWHLKPENPFFLIFRLYHQQFPDHSVHSGLIDPRHLALAGDGTPVPTAAQQRKKRICDCKEKGCSSCNCKRHYSQPDSNWGWDSHQECYFFGCHLYMYVASDSFSDLPVFPLLERASRHDMLSFLHSFFTMKAYLPEFQIEKAPSGFCTRRLRCL